MFIPSEFPYNGGCLYTVGWRSFVRKRFDRRLPNSMSIAQLVLVALAGFLAAWLLFLFLIGDMSYFESVSNTAQYLLLPRKQKVNSTCQQLLNGNSTAIANAKQMDNVVHR